MSKGRWQSKATGVGARLWALTAIIVAVACVVSTDAQKSASEPRPNLEGTWRLSPGLGTPRLSLDPPFQPWAEQFFKDAQLASGPIRRVVPCAWCSSHHESSLSV